MRAAYGHTGAAAAQDRGVADDGADGDPTEGNTSTELEDHISVITCDSGRASGGNDARVTVPAPSPSKPVLFFCTVNPPMSRALPPSLRFKPMSLCSLMIFAGPKGLTIVPSNAIAMPLPPLCDVLIVYEPALRSSRNKNAIRTVALR